MYGKDDIGKFFARHLKNKNIEAPASNIVDGNSGIFVAVLNQKGDTLFDKADTRIFQKQQFPKIDWDTVKVIMVLSSTSAKILKQLIKVKRARPDITLCVEMSGGKTAEHIAPYLSCFDFYISNRREAQSIGNVSGVNKNINAIVKHLLAKGVKLAIITSGKHSVLVGNSINNTVIKYPLKKVIKRAISSVGAGDTFTAAFCAAHYIYGKNIKHSVNAAMDMSALTVSNINPVIDRAPEHIYNSITR